MNDTTPDLLSLIPRQRAGAPASVTRAAILQDPEDIALTPSEAFERFHDANPHVYDLLVRSARAYKKQTGHEKCGMSLLFGRARWVLAVETDEGDPGLNNNYASFYARLVMAQEADLSTMFDLRRSTADEWINDYISRKAVSR